MKNIPNIKTADEIFNGILNENEQLIKIAQEEGKKDHEVEAIDVSKVAETLRKSAEPTDIEKLEEKPEEKPEEKKPEKKPEEKPEEEKPEEKKPEEKPEEKKAADVGPGPPGGGPEGMPAEPVIKEEKPLDDTTDKKTDVALKEPLDQGTVKEVPAPDAGIKGPAPDDKPKEIEQPKKVIIDGEKPNNEIKTAMDKLVKVCQDLYPDEELEKDAKLKFVNTALYAGIKKVAPFLFVAGGGASGATAVASKKRKKELPLVYGAGVRRGYGAGARASASAYMKHFGRK